MKTRSKIARLAVMALTVASLLGPWASPASAATVTGCQDADQNPRFAAAYSHRTATQVQAVRGDYWVGEQNAFNLCLDPGGTDAISASAGWLGISGGGPTELIQMGLARCSGCDDLADALGQGFSGAGRQATPLPPLSGIPDDGNVYLWLSWGGSPLPGGPEGSGPEPVKLVQWNGAFAPRFEIFRGCSLDVLPTCSQTSSNYWWFVFTQDGTDPVAWFAGGPACCADLPNKGWSQLNESEVSWIASEATHATIACEVLDRGDQCGGLAGSGPNSTMTSIKVKDWTPTPPADDAGWVNPKLNGNGSCDLVQEPWMSCQTSTTSGGNPDSRWGSVRLETVDTR